MAFKKKVVFVLKEGSADALFEKLLLAEEISPKPSQIFHTDPTYGGTHENRKSTGKSVLTLEYQVWGDKEKTGTDFEFKSKILSSINEQIRPLVTTGEDLRLASGGEDPGEFSIYDD